ncbi:MAG TPA: HD domain-containing phosphohydrolase [Solirubrobacteraceae bacterium]
MSSPRHAAPAPGTERLRLAELLVGLSRVADIGMGFEPGEAARAAVIAAGLARALDAPEPSDVYYTALLQHIGCTAYAHEAAALLGGDEIAVKAAAARTDFGDVAQVLAGYLPRLAPDADAMTRLRAAAVAALRSRQITAGYSRANCEVAALTARRIGLGAGVQRGLADMFESWNGKGAPQGLRAEAIALPARIAQVAATAALFDRIGGAALASATVARRAGRSLDPVVAREFCVHAETTLSELAGADAVVAAVEAEPGRPVGVSEHGLDEVCRAFGDAVDLKSPFHHGHSAGVAELAAGAGEALGLGAADVAALRRAAHLHDLGRAAVPNGIWEKPGPLTSSDWERVRLHAYHGERVLTGCGPLAALAPLVGLHHERMDGSGYHRQTTAPFLPMPARVLAAADVYQAMTQPRAHRLALTADGAAAELTAEAIAGRLDGDAVGAVLAAAGQPVTPVRRAAPAGLTERQVEVLRLVAQGLSNPQIAALLVVSRRTAERHVQDIYARIGVSSRAAAALFAMEHDLLR